MTNMSLLVRFSFGVVELMLMLFGLVITTVSRDLERPTKRFFTAFFSMLCLCAVSNLLIWGTSFVGSLPGPVPAAVFIQSFLCGALSLLITAYLHFCSGIRLKKSAVFYTALTLVVLYTALLCSTFFSEAFYYFTQEGHYRRGPWYPLLSSPLALVLVLDTLLLLRRRKRLSGRQFSAFLICLTLPLAGALAQMLFSGYPIAAYALAVASVLQFGFVFADQTETNRRRQEELLRQRANVTVLQMRPHFIYNTMTSIYYLISQDAEKAQRVTLDFTNYLRKNFSAVAKDQPIPFTEELEHTEAYLAVEQVRFEDLLTVTYDTPYTVFRVPPLTLQPLVENAVKHRAEPDRPLSIRISTGKNGNAYVITVEDTGPGFCENNAAGSSRPALENIRERLELMCGGTLTVSPLVGGGTSAVVTIPISSPHAAPERKKRAASENA